ncbi:hypothetical protein ACFYM2_20585 [Streptomyces sp. NPDC006711]|uniref:hypothetical protein n=1 Tax=Streptomyces sp. NPDC006711 TaxID=3364762 RepID=UPI003693A60A
MTTAQTLTVHTTTDSQDKAAAPARGAVQTRLAARAQIAGPLTSIEPTESTELPDPADPAER